MLPRKPRKFATYACPVLIVVFLGLAFWPIPNARATGKDTAAVAADYRTKCALCHGPDGSGSAVGKSMKVPDLRSLTVQKQPDADLARIISDGKGAMPSFKSSLNNEQIQALVARIRTMAPKK